MALTKVTGQVIKNTTDVTVGVLTVTNTLAVGGTVSIGGTLTYEDVTNVDAVGLITARNGIVVGSGITLSKDGDGFFTGIVTATTFSGSLAASNLTGALPAISGANLTNLDASDLASGTVPTARLGSGTASSSTFLRGDSTFATVTTTTINSNADNRVITGSDSADTLNGESNFTFDGVNINQSMSSDNRGLKQVASGNNYIINTLNANRSSANDLLAMIEARWNSTHVADISFHAGSDTTNKDDGYIKFRTSASAGGISERLRIDSTGRVSAGKHGVGTYNDASEWFKVQSDDTAANISIVGSNATHSSLNLGDEDDFNIQKIKSDHTDNSLQFFTDNTERLRIDSSGRSLIGNTDGATYADSSNDDLIIGSTSNGKNDGITILSGTAQNGSLAFADSGGTSRGLVGYVHNGDYLRFHAGDTLKARIDTDGLKFNSDNASANALDDYEEGTYTPNITYGTSDDGNKTYASRGGNYTKIGRKVQVNININLSNRGTGSGRINFSLPFSVDTALDNTAFEAGGVVYYFANLSSSVTCLNTIAQEGSSIVSVRGSLGSASTSTQQLEYAHLGNSTEFRATITYFTAS